MSDSPQPYTWIKDLDLKLSDKFQRFALKWSWHLKLVFVFLSCTAVFMIILDNLLGFPWDSKMIVNLGLRIELKNVEKEFPNSR